MLFRSDRKSTRLNSSHTIISYAVFCLKKKNTGTRPSLSGGGGPYARAVRSQGAALAVRRGASRSGHAVRRGRGRVQCFRFFFNDPGTTDIYPLSLPGALRI